MKRRVATFSHAMVLLLSALVLAGTPLLATGSSQSMVMARADLKWKEMGNGVAAAPVSGDMDKGPSRFFLKYPVGLVTPQHHHDADHYVTVVSGMITLNVDGKDHKLGPGSYFNLTNKAPHTARVEGKEDAILFVQADGPWNVVMTK